MKIESTKDIKKKEKVHICLYGASGTGKTKMIETLQGRTLILNADKGLLTLGAGSGNIDYTSADNFNDVIQFMKYIKSDENNYDNIAIDSVSAIADLLLKHLEKEGIKGFDMWGAYAKYIGGIITTLRDSTKFNSVSIFELVEKENESGLLSKKVGLQGSLASRVGYFYDFFFAARQKTVKGEQVYKIQTQTGEGFECKSRLEGLEKFIEPDLGALMEKLRA